MSRLAWVTDIHLDFLDGDGVQLLCERITACAPDAVLVGGDIADGASVTAHLAALADALVLPLYFVLGNHDYYGARIADVRAAASDLSRERPLLRWLPAAGVILLADGRALVGVDGWSDGRAGDWEGSQVMLNDYLRIDDLVTSDKVERRRRVEALGRESAERLAVLLHDAAASSRNIVVLTHVPPFAEACWHEGKTSGRDWLPHFTCVATGEVLLAAAERDPDTRITVLCGHTHSPGEVRPLPNLRVLTGGARYGEVRAPVLVTDG